MTDRQAVITGLRKLAIDWRRTLAGLLLSAALGSLVAGLAGAAAHLLSAWVTRDFYELAIGDHVIPGAPIDSWLWGPLFIGFFTTWWVGVSFTPAIFLATFAGLWSKRRSILIPLFWAYAVGALAWERLSPSAFFKAALSEMRFSGSFSTPAIWFWCSSSSSSRCCSSGIGDAPS